MSITPLARAVDESHVGELPLEERFALVENHYERLRPGDRTDHIKYTPFGMFAHSPLRLNYAILQHLIARGILTSDSLMLEAGCGDGRVAATAACLGIPVVAVEGDEELSSEAEQSVLELGLEGALDANLVTVLHGSYLDDRLYEQHGMRFDQFTHVFSYVGNPNPIIQKVSDDSNHGTKFLYCSDDRVHVYWYKNTDLRFEELVKPRLLLPGVDIGAFNQRYTMKVFNVQPCN